MRRDTPRLKSDMTLEKAIELGEYNPVFLSKFPKWKEMSRHVQFQHIRQALDNRHKQLITQYAETVNMLDFSKKPELAVAIDNIMDQIKNFEKDREQLYIEYSK